MKVDSLIKASRDTILAIIESEMTQEMTWVFNRLIYYINKQHNVLCVHLAWSVMPELQIGWILIICELLNIISPGFSTCVLDSSLLDVPVWPFSTTYLIRFNKYPLCMSRWFLTWDGARDGPQPIVSSYWPKQNV